MQISEDFVVVDTEGKGEVKEIAIIDSTGKLIYEAFNQGILKNSGIFINPNKLKSLSQIVADCYQKIQSKKIVCHNAEHDRNILRESFRKVGESWPKLTFVCTYELSKLHYHNLPSYSLEYLSKHHRLKVKDCFFNPKKAHSARYDAEFTHQLYLKIMNKQTLQEIKNQLNPFSNSRVDNPFQNHPDFKQVYQREFLSLKSAVTEIKEDPNHQSKGAVVIGEPGTGKTHLMMRLAQELLQVNRLLFIRQPNNPDAVLYHIYTRILESFVEEVSEKGYTQLEYLLAHSFVKLISATRHIILTHKDQHILSTVKDNHLNLYQELGSEGTKTKRDYWHHIQKRTNEWWVDRYGLAGYSANILKGIVKFCSYTDQRKKQLVANWLAANEVDQDELDEIGLNNWKEDMSREEFSLQAISVFSKLSLLDEPLIIVFDQLEGLGLEHNRKLLENFGEAVKEIFTQVPNSLIILNVFPDRWEQFKPIWGDAVVDRASQYELRLEKLSNQMLAGILKTKAEEVGVSLEALFTPLELESILNQKSVRAVLNRAAQYYRHKVQGVPLYDSPSRISLPREPKPQASLEQKSGPQASLEQRIERLEQAFYRIEASLKSSSSSMQLDTSFEEDIASSSPTFAPSSLHSSIKESEGEIYLYWKERRSFLDDDYSKLKIITDNDDLGKLLTIAESFRLLSDIEIDQLHLGRSKLPEHITIANNGKVACIGFLHKGGSSFTARIKNLNELTIDRKDCQFTLCRDIREPEVKGKVGKEEIEKLNSTSNGEFLLLQKNERLELELIYSTIVDIENRDLEVDMKEALRSIMQYLPDCWLIKVFRQLGCQ